jgi:hypothetical protein
MFRLPFRLSNLTSNLKYQKVENVLFGISDYFFVFVQIDKLFKNVCKGLFVIFLVQFLLSIERD